MWEMKELILYLGTTSIQRVNDLDLLGEICHKDYESSALYK